MTRALKVILFNPKNLQMKKMRSLEVKWLKIFQIRTRAQVFLFHTADLDEYHPKFFREYF